jgi:hypothetical protein
MGEAPQPPPPALETRWEPPALELSGRADGPAPWAALTLLCLACTGTMWGAAEYATPIVCAGIAIAGLVCFWLLLPKAETGSRLPGWALIPLVAGFIAGLFLSALLANLDDQLTASGYWLWFVLWLQFGLWLTERFGRID